MGKSKSENLLPKTPGAVCAQMVRCGKPSCKCADGQLHGPYYYYFTRSNGQLRKRYIKRREVHQVQAACDTYKNEARRQRSQRKTDKRSFHSLQCHLAELEKLITQMMNGE